MDWEIHSWEEFLSTIGNVLLVEDSNDQVVWKYTSSGRYSCRSLRTELVKEVPVAPSWKLMWSVPAPLKIKLFIWLLLRGKLSLRDRLARIGVIPLTFNVCSFCRSTREDVRHMFLHYNSTSSLWYNIARFWDVSFVSPPHIQIMFDV